MIFLWHRVVNEVLKRFCPSDSAVGVSRGVLLLFVLNQLLNVSVMCRTFPNDSHWVRTHLLLKKLIDSFCKEVIASIFLRVLGDVPASLAQTYRWAWNGPCCLAYQEDLRTLGLLAAWRNILLYWPPLCSISGVCHFKLQSAVSLLPRNWKHQQLPKKLNSINARFIQLQGSSRDAPSEPAALTLPCILRST